MMKKFVAFVAIFLATSMVAGNLYAQSNSGKKRVNRKEQRAREKAAGEVADAASYEQAVQAIKAKQFVLEANQLLLSRGRKMYVNSTTNFVLVNLDKATVQVASNSMLPSPNGIGGVTVDGRTSDIDIQMTKNGNIECRFGIQGAGISAQIFLTLYKDDNEASIVINPNFNSQDITLIGDLVPLEQSKIYKGMAF